MDVSYGARQFITPGRNGNFANNIMKSKTEKQLETGEYMSEQWHVVKGDPLWKVVVGEGHKAMTIAECIRKEDAQLMAASQELLEALKETTEVLAKRGNINLLPLLTANSCLIAKAESK